MRISDWSSDVCSSDLAEQLAPAEGHRAGVEDRQVVLVAVGHVEVEQPRLQGVDVVVAAEADVAVEVQPGVERADRRAAAGRCLGVAGVEVFGQLVVEPVAGVAPRQGRGDEPARAAQRHAHRSEEHTSELQSLMRISYAVFCLKKNNKHSKTIERTEQT